MRHRLFRLWTVLRMLWSNVWCVQGYWIRKKQKNRCVKTIIGRSTNTFYTPTKNQNSPCNEMVGSLLSCWNGWNSFLHVTVWVCNSDQTTWYNTKHPRWTRHWSPAGKPGSRSLPCWKRIMQGSVVSCGTSTLSPSLYPYIWCTSFWKQPQWLKHPHALLLIHLNGHRSFYPRLERLRATSRLWYIRRIFVCTWARGWWLPCVKVRKHMVVPSWTIKSG